MLKSTAKAPGSCMIMGEHAVLHGYSAICMSLDSAITATVSPRKDGQIQIKSELGTWIGELNALPKEPEFEFVSNAIQSLEKYLNSGFDLTITSDFPVASGLGSSTAVVVATLNALIQSVGLKKDKPTLFEMSLAVIRQTQGAASGADVAACVYGGCIFYQKETVEVLPNKPQIELLFSGTKIPTKFVVAEVERLDQAYREDIFEQIEQATLAAREAIIGADWHELAIHLFENQRLMEDLGLDTPELTLARETMMQKTGVIASKISGAGMGDYVLGLVNA